MRPLACGQPLRGMRGRYHYLLQTRRWVVPLGDSAPAAHHAAQIGPAAAHHLGTRGAATGPRRHAAVPQAAAGLATEAGGSAAAVPELVAWVQSRGGRVTGATLANLAGRDGGSGWGLKASQDAAPGQQLILLPAACHLTYGESEDPRLLALIDRVPAELWGAKLALQLLRHRALDTPDFGAYIRHLPVGVPGLPMFFSKSAIDLIDYPPVTAQVKKRCRWLYDFSQQVLAPLPGSPADPFGGAAVDLNALGWALACVSSRAFRTRGPAHPAAMLPLIDMANHTFDPNCEVLPAEGGGVALVARRPVAAGQPLLLSYGKLSNDFLLLDYGFIVPDNPHDTVQLRFDVGLLQAACLAANVRDTLGAPLDVTPTPWKAAKLAELRLAGPNANTEINIGGPESLDPRLLAGARVMAARTEDELSGRTPERLCAVDRPLSRQNEAAALAMVGGVLAVALSNFTTSLEQDLALLAAARNGGTGGAGAAGTPQQGGGGPPPLASEDEVLAVSFRAEKKRMLTRALQRVGALARATVADKELRQATGAAAAPKGTKPAPATGKGFGGGGKKK